MRKRDAGVTALEGQVEDFRIGAIPLRADPLSLQMLRELRK